MSVVSVCFNADMFLMNLRAVDEALDAFFFVLYDIFVILSFFVSIFCVVVLVIFYLFFDSLKTLWL